MTPPGGQKTEEGEVEAGVSPGCLGEAARPLRAECAPPRLANQRTAVDMKQLVEAWTEELPLLLGRVVGKV